MLEDSDDGLYSELSSLWTFPSSDKTKYKRLKLQRFEIYFWFGLQVQKIRSGGRGWVVKILISWIHLTKQI
jgi:hypothetical protein